MKILDEDLFKRYLSMHVPQLKREIDLLNRLILQLGGRVEENLRFGVQSVKSLDAQRARELADEDERVNRLEVRIEEECFKVLALHHPLASDLRYVIALMKINHDLERIGDLADNLSRRAAQLAEAPMVAFPHQLEDMAAQAREMLRNSLDALIDKDIDSCRGILLQDDEVDRLLSEVEQWFGKEVMLSPGKTTSLFAVYQNAKDLERIADHTCNIAEDIIYLVSGEIVRHRSLDQEFEDE